MPDKEVRDLWGVIFFGFPNALFRISTRFFSPYLVYIKHIGLQKATALLEDAKKVNIPGEPLRTAANYRSIQRKCDALLGELTIPPDTIAEAGLVLVPLKETLTLLGKSSAIMSDYLEGKLSLAPPNPDWVGRSQEYSAQAQARLRETQQALGALRKKIE